MEHRELIGELVEGRRRIVETVTNDRSPFGSRVPQAIDPVDMHSALTFDVMTKVVGVARKVIEFRFESAEVVSSPLALEPYAV
jgi:hypothetical protein